MEDHCGRASSTTDNSKIYAIVRRMIDEDTPWSGSRPILRTCARVLHVLPSSGSPYTYIFMYSNEETSRGASRDLYLAVVWNLTARPRSAPRDASTCTLQFLPRRTYDRIDGEGGREHPSTLGVLWRKTPRETARARVES